MKFSVRDVYRPKAAALAKLLSKKGALGTTLHAHEQPIQELDINAIRPDVVVVGVDNQFEDTREFVCRWCYDHGVPAVFIAVTTDADGGYVFVQQPGDADWACVFKPESNRATAAAAAERCPGTPASVDILKALCGRALYAVDTLLMERPRNWNYWYLSLRSAELGGGRQIERRPGCPVCSDG